MNLTDEQKKEKNRVRVMKWRKDNPDKAALHNKQQSERMKKMRLAYKKLNKLLNQ